MVYYYIWMIFETNWEWCFPHISLPPWSFYLWSELVICIFGNIFSYHDDSSMLVVPLLLFVRFKEMLLHSQVLLRVGYNYKFMYWVNLPYAFSSSFSKWLMLCDFFIYIYIYFFCTSKLKTFLTNHSEGEPYNSVYCIWLMAG